MKKLILTIFLLTLIIINVNAEKNNKYLYNMIIYLDPGHGGKDPGAISENIKEKDITLNLSKEIKKHLIKQGAKVYLTRYDDYDLSLDNKKQRKKQDLLRRAQIINETNPDIYISVHLNSDPNKTYQGPQIYYDSVNKDNKNLANTFTNTFKKQIKTTRNTKNNNTLYMERRIKTKGILLEAGFISNQEEKTKLLNKTYQSQIADLVTKSIINYRKKL